MPPDDDVDDQAQTETDTPDVDDTRTDFEQAVDAGEAKILELLTTAGAENTPDPKATADVIRSLIDTAQDFIHDLADAQEISAAAPAEGAPPGQTIDPGGTVTETAGATALPDDPNLPPAAAGDDSPAQPIPSPSHADAPAELGGTTGEEPGATALPD